MLERARAGALIAAVATFATACASPDPVISETPAASAPDGAEAAGPLTEQPPAEPVAQLEFTVDEDSASTPDGTIVARAVTDEVTARVAPDDAAAEVVTLSHPTERGGARVFEVITADVIPTPEWLEVRLPIRPNGTTGWIRSTDVELSANPYRIEIDTSDFELILYRLDEAVLSTPIAVGTGDTPTPYGEFYITELLQPSSPDGPYGPYAFGLSGFSEVLTSFAGGEGVIGIHGTNDPAAIGTNVSFGCVRVDNSTIEWMAETVPLGTPVEIRA